MLPLVGRDESRAIDAKAIAAGVPGLVLMENAGRGATDVLCARFADRLRRPLVVGGLGQNGGDAWVVARHLLVRGVCAECVVLGDPAKVAGDARVNLDALRGLGVDVRAVAESDLEHLESLAARASVIVDGLFGTGLDRVIDGFRADAIQRLAATEVPSFALDLPSGLDAQTGAVLGVVLPARVTATFAAHKRGLHQHPGVDHAGDVVLVDIGVPAPRDARASLLERFDLARLVPRRAADAHKGSAGHVAIFAGSPGRTGAALLSGLGAMRAGAGLVTLAARGAARAALDTKVIELMTSEIPEALEAGVAAALRECEQRDAGVLGPGVGLDATARAYTTRVAIEATIPLVLDADALSALAGDPTVLTKARAPRVLTPHPGEAARLLGTTSAEVQAARYHAAEQLAARTGQVVVLKGARTIIASRERLAVCPAGTPALGVAGTGDVLSGVIAAMLASASEGDVFDAACAGVLAHAMAGELAAVADRGLFAREVADAVPHALARSRAHAASAT
ncbi:bifunctional ADP-dependent NAD(P)H-hydrate dehydratase/NAD(P)H-hydrate epimerase [Sandaracinus amylolyticus]|uniref:Bifunctional NAD(P)H-hydrate repair enzyme n=1 Tax=Sandaracinus amylolyticus TaxID=927083 RepID=A0A0F6W3U0_9BACT|nr:bifunctional ADP-dependent NAD(P)H-hydrate dehydratase/NAD(P)H-hydrate epimerase [Sandaracinus amylolyticus]AKF06621.1 NAD(P)HX epimerase / NAD(P)HX dehydratase [Sandaracinus amylolyticus]